MDFFVAVVNYVNSVTTVIDHLSQGTEIHYLLLLLLITTVITYRSYHHQLYYYQYGDNGNN